MHTLLCLSLLCSLLLEGIPIYKHTTVNQFESFPVFDYYEQSWHEHYWMSSCGYLVSFLFSKYLRVDLWDHKAGICLALTSL